jgi:hypothetical protein
MAPGRRNDRERAHHYDALNQITCSTCPTSNLRLGHSKLRWRSSFSGLGSSHRPCSRLGVDHSTAILGNSNHRPCSRLGVDHSMAILGNSNHRPCSRLGVDHSTAILGNSNHRPCSRLGVDHSTAILGNSRISSCRLIRPNLHRPRRERSTHIEQRFSCAYKRPPIISTRH